MRICSIDGCGKKTLARGMCSAHYAKQRKYGDPLEARQAQLHGLTLVERWSAYVQKCTGCWEWQGFRDTNGYGRLNIKNVPVLAHRVAWEIFRGTITPEQHVLHRCDNPRCVRPEHLFLGDQAANNADKIAKKRQRYGVSRGEAHGCSKLISEQVKAIRAAAGTVSAIAREFHVSRTQVRDIRERRSWRHI